MIQTENKKNPKNVHSCRLSLLKFQKNRHKIVGEAAHKLYPRSISFECNNAWKMTKFNLWKSDKK